MKIIPIKQRDDQYFNCTFGDDSYRMRLLDRGTAGVFLDVYREDKLLLPGLACLDRVRIIRSPYKRFPGDLMFVDQEGFDNPQFSYFNTRFQLNYLTEDEDDLGL